MKTAEIFLPFYSKGDDLKMHMELSGSIDEAFESYAQKLEQAAQSLREIKALLAGHEVNVFAEDDSIEIEASDGVIDALEKGGLVIDW